MTENVQDIGVQFAERRKELKLSLKEAESATSIRSTYLEAIEAGNMDKLISPVYAQGFVRQYATFLGLDGDRIVTENPEIFLAIGSSRRIQTFFDGPSHKSFRLVLGPLNQETMPSAPSRGFRAFSGF
jgi:hypothetical protein